MDLRSLVEQKLRDALAPARLDIVDDSAAHAGHGASGAHVSVSIVSSAFEGKSLVQRHRLINAALKDELASGAIHALQIAIAKTPAEAGAAT